MPIAIPITWTQLMQAGPTNFNLTKQAGCDKMSTESEGKKMKKQAENRETWVGYRPSVIPAKKNNKKHERKNNKQVCRNAMKGEY